MQHADDDLLAALALQETGDPEVEAARAHVAGCGRCAAELSDLQSVLGLTGEPVPLVAPPPRVWESIRRELAAERMSADVVPLPARRGVPTWLASVAAAAALVVGLGGGFLLAGDEDPAPQAGPEPTASPTPGESPGEPTDATVVASTQLASLDDSAADRGRAEVRRHDDRVVLHVAASDLDGPEGIREVWLINEDGTRMISLGLLASGESGDFPFPERLLEEGYRIVDISYEPDDGDPVHSGRSLARGTMDLDA